MTCQKMEELLSAYSEGELPAEEQQRVRLHLEQCPSCERTLRQLERAWELLGDFDELEPAPVFQAQVWERIRTAPPERSWGWRWLWGLVAATAVTLVVLGTLGRAPVQAPVASVDQEVARLAPQWDLEPGSELPEILEAPSDEAHLEPLQLGQLSDSWLDEAHEALDQELGGS